MTRKKANEVNCNDVILIEIAVNGNGYFALSTVCNTEEEWQALRARLESITLAGMSRFSAFADIKNLGV
jgi:hypothetical protein